MAMLLRIDGSSEKLTPANGTHWSLAEMQALVGGYIQIVNTKGKHWLVLDEEGKLKGRPVNRAATQLYEYGKLDPIVGDALLIDNYAELNGPEDEE